MAGTANFSVEKGDTFLRNITFRNKTTQVPVNLTGATITAFIEKSNVKVADLVGSVTDGALGKFAISMAAVSVPANPGGIPPTAAIVGTDSLAAGTYTIEVKVTFTDATVKTLITGNFVVTD